MAEGKKAIPAPKGLQPNLSSTKMGTVCRFDEREYDSFGMVQIEDYGERTESKAEYKMPWTSRAKEEIITRGWLAMRNRAMFLHPIAVSEFCNER